MSDIADRVKKIVVEHLGVDAGKGAGGVDHPDAELVRSVGRGPAQRPAPPGVDPEGVGELGVAA